MSWRRSDYNDRIRKECGVRPKYLSKFWLYHDTNPHVFARYLQAAKKLEREGHKRIGAKMIAEEMRHLSRIKTVDPDGFKLGNNYTAYYARLLVLARPSLGDCITLRTMGVPGYRTNGPVRPFDQLDAKARSKALRALWTADDEEGQ